MMRSLRFRKPNTLHIDLSTPIPTPSPTQYLLRVHATAITANELTWPETLQQQASIPGHDVCGTIVSTAAAAETSAHFNIGDEVIALTSFSREGAAAEYVLAEATELAPKPKNLLSREAAAVPLSVLTAWQALFVHGGLTHGSSSGVDVLILGAAGGVGVMAVQVARWIGARRIVGTCSARNGEFVKSLGAHDVIDYTKAEVEGRFDVVLDCVGGKAQEGCWGNVRDGGVLVSVAAELPEGKKKEYPGVRSVFFIVEPNGEQLDMLGGLFEKGELKAFVDSEFGLEDGAAAFDLLSKGHARGKIVLTL